MSVFIDPVLSETWPIDRHISSIDDRAAMTLTYSVAQAATHLRGARRTPLSSATALSATVAGLSLIHPVSCAPPLNYDLARTVISCRTQCATMSRSLVSHNFLVRHTYVPLYHWAMESSTGTRTMLLELPLTKVECCVSVLSTDSCGLSRIIAVSDKFVIIL